VTKESCTNVVQLGQRRYQKAQEEVWDELAEAIAALKDAERHLLKVNIAMENAQWSTDKIEEVRAWARGCQEAEEGSHSFFRLVCALLDYEDPFSSGSESES
jgi:hypothetical protein